MSMTLISICFVLTVLCFALVPGRASWERDSAQRQKASSPRNTFARMADGKRWMTQNLSVKMAGSYCYQEAEPTCSKYGRLYTWEAALHACESLGEGSRLPTDDDWRQMAKHYGGISEDSVDGGKGAYEALLTRGSSGFNALLGGNRSNDGQYARLEAHGFYWTASEDNPASAVFYNFAHGKLALYRQTGGEKASAFSVRCIKQ
jgi:uncharacterized protein (TIGR02145 family)